MPEDSRKSVRRAVAKPMCHGNQAKRDGESWAMTWELAADATAAPRRLPSNSRRSRHDCTVQQCPVRVPPARRAAAAARPAAAAAAGQVPRHRGLAPLRTRGLRPRQRLCAVEARHAGGGTGWQAVEHSWSAWCVEASARPVGRVPCGAARGRAHGRGGAVGLGLVLSNHLGAGRIHEPRAATNHARREGAGSNPTESAL